MNRTDRIVLALLAGLAPAASQAATLTRGPYLQQVTETSALVVWRTSTAAACTLAYTPPGSTPRTIVTPERTQHVASLVGLQAGTRYPYTIRSGGVLVGGDEYFLRTAPRPGTGATERMVVWGDCGFGGATQMAVAAVLGTQDANLGIVVGDIIYPSGQASYYDPRYFQPYAPLIRHTPVWAALGNHDMGEPQAFYDAWYLPTNPVDGTERFYSFDYGDLHIVALDSNQSWTSSVLNWLAADLDASNRRWKMVFFHHTVYSCGDYHGSSSTNIATLCPIFDAHGVDLVLYGHDHHYERSYPMRGNKAMDTAQNPNYVDPSGPIYVISGAGGSTRSSSESCTHTARAISTPSFVRITVTGDQLTLEAVDTSASVIDRMTVRKSGSPPPPPPPPPETITVTSPSGGEAYAIGSPLPVRWTASSNIAAVRVELSRAAAGPWETLVASTPNDGEWIWTSAGLASSTCWIRASDASDGAPSDVSNASFELHDPIVEPPPPPPPPPAAVAIGVNFQPATAPVPAAFVDDLGLPYDPVETYGWAQTMVVRARGIIPDDPRDSFVDVVNNAAPGVWEIALPNGNYRVSLICGDPLTTATHRVAIEGQIIVRDVLTVANQFHEVSLYPVLVQDGRLTMTLGGNGDITHTKVNSIVIIEAGPAEHAITSPRGGENYCSGAQIPCRWTGATAGNNVNVQLSRSGPAGPWESLGTAQDNGESLWMAAGAASANCYFRLVDTHGSVLAQSSAPFAISEPQIQLRRPMGGEVWTTGSVRSFEWASSCLAGDVRIDVSRSGPAGPWTTIIPSTVNDGVESYTVKHDDVGWTYVRVVSLPWGSPTDANDAPFTVLDPPSSRQSWHFDFTPAVGSVAFGYDPDSGEPYDATRGRGWNVPVLLKQRNMLPNDARDTFVQVVNNTTAVWNLDLPNGGYVVSLVCGDPYTSATHRVALEGQIVVADVYSIGGSYVVRSEIPVTVQDGKLTMTVGGSGQITSTKVCCIDVYPAGSDPSPNRPRRARTMEIAALQNRLEPTPALVRGATSFALELADPSPVRLTVHDVRGRTVAVLHEGELPAGRHLFAWDPHDAQGQRLPSGVYFLRLDSTPLHQSRKIILIR